MIHVIRFIASWRRLPVFFVVVNVAPLYAQTPLSERVRTTNVDSVLNRFEGESRVRAGNSMGLTLATEIIRLPNSHAARRDSLLDGLQKLALTSDSRYVRGKSVSLIALAGTSGRTAPPLPRIMPRLALIYRLQPDASVQLAIRNAMPEQAERQEAAAFLRAVATEADPTNDGSGPHGHFSVGDPRTEALSRLSEMGADGRAVLQAMHRSGEARSPQARAILARMAQRGFPVIDARRREQ